jgi:hypothetical protein
MDLSLQKRTRRLADGSAVARMLTGEHDSKARLIVAAEFGPSAVRHDCHGPCGGRREQQASFGLEPRPSVLPRLVPRNPVWVSLLVQSGLLRPVRFV